MKWIRLTLLLLVMVGASGYLAIQPSIKPNDCKKLKAQVTLIDKVLYVFVNEQISNTLTPERSNLYATKISGETLKLKSIRVWDSTLKSDFSELVTELSAFPSKARNMSDSHESITQSSLLMIGRIRRYCEF